MKDLHFILCVSIILINSMYYLIVNSEELDICDGSENMFINNPDPYSSCGSFILCTENGPQAPDVCPEGFYFNFKDQICDHPANVNCTEPIQCDDDTDVGFYMLPYSCTTYIWCFQGTRRTLNCAPGLHFDVELGMCNFADVVNCHRDLCVYAIPGDFIPSPNNCNDFYVCYNGDIRRFTCPDGLYFNPAISSCDFPNNTKCDLTPFACSVSEGLQFYRHKGSCTKYWRCENGIPESRSCQPGLKFNQKTFLCDLPDNVECIY